MRAGAELVWSDCTVWATVWALWAKYICVLAYSWALVNVTYATDALKPASYSAAFSPRLFEA